MRQILPDFEGPELDGALCAEIGGDWWHPDKGGENRSAKKICARCPVQVECLTWALDNDEPFGIWGGLTERERRKLRKAS